MSVYFDASVIVPLFIDDPLNDRANRLIEDHSPRPMVSDFAAAEVASALSRLVRIGRVEHTHARAALADFDVWRSRVAGSAQITPADVSVADAYLRRLDLNLRTPDGLHIAMAFRLGAPLATFDVAMAECARMLGVELAPL